jgi:SAM-dependent methyltransferase
MSKFEQFYQKAAQLGTSPTLVVAMKFFAVDPPRARRLRAVDLGCGEGRNTEALLKAGFEVVAVDCNPRAIELLNERMAKLSPDEQARVTIQQADFARAEWGEVDLVNSEDALPFCSPLEFPDVWRKVVNSINLGGRFIGSFFGVRKTWPVDTFALSRSEVSALFDEFTRIDLSWEEEFDKLNMHDVSVHWHSLRCLATK